MTKTLRSLTTGIRRCVLPCIILAVGFVAGTAVRHVDVVEADVRQTKGRPEPRRSPNRSAFQSGSERSESIMREIATTLKRIDGRVERIERALSAKPRQQGN